jgi:SAM-dependent methyltransferase
MPMIRLTERAHDFIRPVLGRGTETAILDATAGNGHDTCFLAREAARGARLIAVDVQEIAVENTRNRLRREGLTAEVRQIEHRDLLTRLDQWFPGGLDAAMLNLGYLPGGDKTLTTRAETTVPLLSKVWELLRGGGRLSILAYRGHPCGARETEAVKAWSSTLETMARVRYEESPLPGPMLICIEKTCPTTGAGAQMT